MAEWRTVKRAGVRLSCRDQRDAPDAGRQSNWLPTPDGRFRPLMRMYQPRAEILNGDYVLPAITKAL